MPSWLNTLLALPALGTALRVLLLALLFLLVRHALRVAERRLLARLQRAVDDPDRLGRLQTLLRVGYGTSLVVLALVVGTMLLTLLGVNIGPVIASAGVAGLAISLGAQTLIRDYLGGILMLVEDQFRVGDIIEVNGISGEVVRMTLRATYLRNVEGKLHTVPNGDIRMLANVTRDWSRAVVDLDLALGTDLGRANQALQAALARLRADPIVGPQLLDMPAVDNWTSVTEKTVQVRILAKTLPGKQWDVARALRREAVQALQAAGVWQVPGAAQPMRPGD
jgi:small conductance mechanosensitive channel